VRELKASEGTFCGEDGMGSAEEPTPRWANKDHGLFWGGVHSNKSGDCAGGISYDEKKGNEIESGKMRGGSTSSSRGESSDRENKDQTSERGGDRRVFGEKGGWVSHKDLFVERTHTWGVLINLLPGQRKSRRV